MTDDIRDDLAYVKALAEEGRDTPLVGGMFYVLWGGLITLAALIAFADISGWISLGPAGGVWPWVVAFVIGWVASMVIGKKSDAKPGAGTIGNKTAAAVWFAVGIFISIFWFALMVFHDNYVDAGLPPYFLMNMMFPVALGLYGIAFFATATAARTGWLRWFAYIAWVLSIISLALLTSKYQLLVGAAGSFFCAVVPGILLMRAEPSDIV